MDTQARLRGRLYWRGDEGYDAARRGAVWRANTPGRYPEAIVMAEEADDVAAAVRLARSQGLRVTAKSGGHSWTSPHLRDGALLIDLSRMQELSIDPAARTAWANPSVKGRRVNDALAPHGLMVPTGHHNTVGCGGFLMCGGFGWNFRQWGNGCANVKAIEVVTAEGEIIRADDSENQDFFWAARGSGPGFFGVVTKFQVGAYKRPSHLRQNGYVFGLDQLEAALTWLYEIGPKAPPFIELVASAASFDADGEWAPTRLAVSGLTFASSEEEAREARALFDTCPIKDKAIARRDSIPTTLEERYDLATAADPEGFRFAADNIYSDAPATAIMPFMRELLETMPTPRSHLFWLFQGRRPDFSNMALSAWGETYIAAYSIWDDEKDDRAMQEWPVAQMRKLDPIANGEGQMNDENMEARPIRYLSEEAERRLEDLRAKHDPEGVFLSFLRG